MFFALASPLTVSQILPDHGILLKYKTPGFSKFEIFIFKFASSENDFVVNIKELKISNIQKNLS